MKPVDPEKMRMMEAKAREIGEVLGRAVKAPGETHGKFGFVLMLLSYDGPEFTYISNVERAGMVKTMQEFIAANPPSLTWDEQHG